jgi:hypothetical protein
VITRAAILAALTVIAAAVGARWRGGRRPRRSPTWRAWVRAWDFEAW